MQGSIGVLLDLKEVTAADVEALINSIRSTPGWNVGDGTGANQADRYFADTRPLAASGTEDLDLVGSLTNLRGTVTFAKLKAILVIADAGNTNNVQVTRPASNGVPWL